jgi:hypothetical protein
MPARVLGAQARVHREQVSLVEHRFQLGQCALDFVVVELGDPDQTAHVLEILGRPARIFNVTRFSGAMTGMLCPSIEKITTSSRKRCSSPGPASTRSKLQCVGLWVSG